MYTQKGNALNKSLATNGMKKINRKNHKKSTSTNPHITNHYCFTYFFFLLTVNDAAAALHIFMFTRW
jgi:hypothetical protein